MKRILLLFFLSSSIECFSQANPQVGSVVCKPENKEKAWHFNPGRLPEFPGGDAVLQNYIATNLILSEKDKNNALDKTVKASFEVDSKGKIWEVALIGKHFTEASELEIKVTDMLCAMPDWIPGGTGKMQDTSSFNVGIRLLVEIRFSIPGFGTDYYPSLTLLPIPRGHVDKPIAGQGVVFTFAETMPNLPGQGFMSYLKENVKYPNIEKEAGKQGTVYVSFVVEKDGSITNVDIAKDVLDAPGLSTEAMRVIWLMPKWTPGKINGHPVRIEMKQPIRFVLQ